MSFSIPKKQIFPLAIIYFIFITSSFDKVLNLVVGGFSIRMCVLAMILFFFLVFTFNIINNRLKIKYLGILYFSIWLIFLIAFIPNSILIGRSVGYLGWLIIYFLFSMALINYAEHNTKLTLNIIQLYMSSFTILALLGILQYLMAKAGYSYYLSHWFDSSKPRVSAFSYEPSYYSTYLIMGWIIHFFLILLDHPFRKIFKSNRSFLIITIAIILSFSRMGLVFIMLICIYYTIKVLLPTFFTSKLRKEVVGFFGILIIIIIALPIYVLSNAKKFERYFVGLPILSKYDHSYSIRLNDSFDTFRIFMESPFQGYSLGGIAPNIARLRGIDVITQEVVKNTEGVNVFAEILAASGIIGFIFFCRFLFDLISKPIRNKVISPELENLNQLNRIFVYALICELLILTLNQNILRNYVWIHIAMINMIYFSIKHADNKLVDKSSIE